MANGPELYGKDLLGNPVERTAGGTLGRRFLLRPFSVLNTATGWWQARKKAWLALGIKSEVGRGGNLLKLSDSIEEYLKPGGSDAYEKKGRRLQTPSLKGGLTFGTTTDPYPRGKGGKRKAAAGGTGFGFGATAAGDRRSAADAGTSVFDPVLCELAYRWWCPPGGQVVDPFAGGSVRGVVAALFGMRYWGCDLREEQVASNYDQLPGIPITVKISAASARLPFHGCEPGYIRDVCKGACCRSTTAPGGALVTIHPSEELKIIDRGAEVVNGFIVPKNGRCTFQGAGNGCGLHGTPDKPFGCIASPFTLNKNGTLIVRNRYKLLRCYDDGPRLPAYTAFRASLDLLFGAKESARIVKHLEAGGGDLEVPMPLKNYLMLRENDLAKGGGGRILEWRAGDSAEELGTAPEADFIFSCPPYGDLEKYSADPRDLSNMDYPTFRRQLEVIIAAAAERLKPDRFACFVVGDFRGPDGNYRNFPAHVTAAFRKAGMGLYNQAILATPAGSLPIRTGKQFEGSRKLGTMHQHVYVYLKGDAKRAAAACRGET